MQLRFAEVISRDDMVICFDLLHVFKAFYGSAKYGFRHYCIYNIVIFNWFNLKRKRKLFGNIKRYVYAGLPWKVLCHSVWKVHEPNEGKWIKPFVWIKYFFWYSCANWPVVLKLIFWFSYLEVHYSFYRLKRSWVLPHVKSSWKLDTFAE